MDEDGTERPNAMQNQINCVPGEQLLTFELILCTNELEVQGRESGPRHMGLCFLVKSR